jgi:hypothetical protein
MCCLNVYQENKKKVYENLRAYINNLLCIKQILFRMNEVDKLKVMTLMDDQKKEFTIDTPFPKHKKIISVWDFE